jgi:hypothetical protein
MLCETCADVIRLLCPRSNKVGSECHDPSPPIIPRLYAGDVFSRHGFSYFRYWLGTVVAAYHFRISRTFSRLVQLGKTKLEDIPVESKKLPFGRTLWFDNHDEHRQCCWLHEKIIHGMKQAHTLDIWPAKPFGAKFEFARSSSSEINQGGECLMMYQNITVKPTWTGVARPGVQVELHLTPKGNIFCFLLPGLLDCNLC